MANGPPKTILAPPPPPAPPPPSTRSVKDVSPRTPLPGGGGFSLGPSPVSTKNPPGMSAPIVPQHRPDVLNKMLRGLEDDSLTVADVLGVLETELRSGAPSGPPLSEQFDRYTSPLGGPPEKGLGAKIRSPEPMPSETRLIGANPTAATPFIGGSTTPRRMMGASMAGYQAAEDTSHVIMNCARCAVLEQQIRALAQSLSGLAARMFNWSLAHCRENSERNGIWHLIVKYLEPVMTVDAKISETCSGLQAAIGTAGSASHVPTDLGPRPIGANGVVRNSAQKRVPSTPVRGTSPGIGNVWQPPGLSASATNFKDGTPNFQTARFAENPVHRAAAPMSPASPNRHLPASAIQQRAHAVKPSPSQITPRTPSSPSSPSRQHAADVGPVVPEISVRFGASKLAKKLNGVYTVVPSLRVNRRPVYYLGQRNIVHLGDGTWAIKDGPNDDLDADVYAYVKDDAAQPHRVRRPWYVAADGDGFVVDSKGSITPGRSQFEVSQGRSKNEQPNEADAGKKAEAALNARQPGRQQPQGGPQESPSQLPRPPVLSEFEDSSFHSQPEKKNVMIPYEDTSGPARIRIKIISAQGLRKADATGSSDPFTICQIPGKGVICKTRPQANTQKPVWDFEHIAQYTPGHTLKFTVWDKDTLSSDFLGETELLTHRFYPYGFRGELALKDAEKKDTQSTLAVTIEPLELALKDAEKKDTQSTLAVTIEPLELADEDRAAQVPVWADDYDYDKEDWNDDQLQFGYHDEDPEVAAYRNVFSQFDVDGSGKISLFELKEAMAGLGYTETEPELRVLMSKVDKTDNGVDFMEFIVLLDKLQQFEDEDPQQAKFRAMFQSFDVDNSGFISTPELKVVLEAVEKREEMTEADINKILNEMDSSCDGYIDFGEYSKMMQKVIHTDGQKQVKAQDITEKARQAALHHTLAPSDKKRIKAFLKRKQFPSEDVNGLKNTGGAFKKKGYEYPLHLAVTENLSDMVWLLLESDADPLATNSAGETPFQTALRVENGRNTHKKVLDHLIAAGGGDKSYGTTFFQ